MVVVLAFGQVAIGVLVVLVEEAVRIDLVVEVLVEEVLVGDGEQRLQKLKILQVYKRFCLPDKFINIVFFLSP
jgi:hypothetical protein